jgi:ABC-type polysaccharide/polyol phosphate transport system ATPase subunit
MIDVQGLRKVYRTRFGDKLVLDGVSFNLRKGERLGVLGRNGAGKSTMIRLVSGAERPTAGSIDRQMSVSWPLAFGGAFQPTLTGIDNIRFISRIYAQDFESNLAFVEEFAELGPYLREPVRSYSSGMRARLAFAISMIIEFDCFLIDEIGAVGDARFHDRCNYELFEKRRDRAMIIISHDANYIRDHCNRWSLLHEGRLVLHDDFDEAYTAYKEAIGASLSTARPVVSRINRGLMIESSQRAALADDRFRVHVQQGDWARDSREWSAAEREYTAALALYPYQRTFWTQLGHVTREQGKSTPAEVAYRTAVALGAPADEVDEFLHSVLAQQHDKPADHPIHRFRPGPAGSQAPGKPDVAAFSMLLWGMPTLDDQELLKWLRVSENCDQLAAAMIADERFAVAGTRSGLEGQAEDGDLPVREWLETIRCLFAPDFDGTDLMEGWRTMQTGDEARRLLAARGALEHWPLTSAALLERRGTPA